MKGLLETAYSLFKKNPPQTYRYEQYAKDVDGTPLFKWIDSEGNWVEAEWNGRGLPKNAIKEYSDSAYEWQKARLDSGYTKPWTDPPIPHK